MRARIRERVRCRRVRGLYKCSRDASRAWDAAVTEQIACGRVEVCVGHDDVGTSKLVVSWELRPSENGFRSQLRHSAGVRRHPTLSDPTEQLRIRPYNAHHFRMRSALYWGSYRYTNRFNLTCTDHNLILSDVSCILYFLDFCGLSCC